MPDAPLSAELAATRTRLDRLTIELGAADAEIARLKPQLSMLDRLGRMGAQGAVRLRAQLEGLRTQRTRLAGEIAATRTAISALRERVLGTNPEAAVATLDGTVPVAMLPVRLETRFVGAPPELRVRIFPDSIHMHAHE